MPVVGCLFVWYNRGNIKMGSIHKERDRGSIPAKVGFWVGLRIFLYEHTPTNLTLF